MFNWGAKVLRFHYPILWVNNIVKHVLLLLFSDVSNIPIFHETKVARKEIYNIFGSSIYSKPHFYI